MVLIFDEDGDGSAESAVFEGAGEDFAGIGFFARCGDIGLSWFASVEGGLDVCFGEGEIGWASIDDDAYGATMGFAESGDAEELSGDGRHGMWFTIDRAGGEGRFLQEVREGARDLLGRAGKAGGNFLRKGRKRTKYFG